MRIFLTALLTLTNFPAIATDACDAQVPRALKAEIEKAFPAFRTPVATDNLAEDVKWDLEQKGKGCLGVAKADFDGNGTKDFLLGLTARKGTGATVLIALSLNGAWQFHQLDAWPEGRSRLYVSAEKPGTYVRTEALEDPLEPGEMSPLKCQNPVAVFGATESTGVAYCYKKNKWQHVWVSD
jgi:hypothetical protein